MTFRIRARSNRLLPPPPAPADWLDLVRASLRSRRAARRHFDPDRTPEVHAGGIVDRKLSGAPRLPRLSGASGYYAGQFGRATLERASPGDPTPLSPLPHLPEERQRSPQSGRRVRPDPARVDRSRPGNGLF